MDPIIVQLLTVGVLPSIIGYFMYKLKKKEQEINDLKIDVAVLKTTVINISEDVKEIKEIVNKISDKI